MSVLYIFAAIIILGVIIFIHEFGHFIAGRSLGIGVVEFAIGMGPRLFGWEKNGTKYSLRAIPLGGFCAFVGEDDGTDSPNAMNAQPAWKRIITVAAGPFMNFLLAFVIAVVLIGTGAIPNIFEAGLVPLISDVVAGSPAENAGIVRNDEIIAINGQSVSFDEEGVKLIQSVMRDGGSSVLTVKREDIETEISVTPEYDEKEGRLMIGVYFPMAYTRYTCGFDGAVPESFRFMGNTVKETIKMLGSLIGRLATGQGVEQGSVSGVVGIVSTMSEGMSYGFSMNVTEGLVQILYYVLAISLSLGIMNMLPFPALDGGRLVLLAIEAVTGKHLKREAEGVINLIGFAVLIVLMVVITYSDIRALFN